MNAKRGHEVEKEVSMGEFEWRKGRGKEGNYNLKKIYILKLMLLRTSLNEFLPFLHSSWGKFLRSSNLVLCSFCSVVICELKTRDKEEVGGKHGFSKLIYLVSINKVSHAGWVPVCLVCRWLTGSCVLFVLGWAVLVSYLVLVDLLLCFPSIGSHVLWLLFVTDFRLQDFQLYC